MPYEPRKNFGRPRISDEKIQEVVQLAKNNVPPKDAIKKTGLKQTKVYEIYRTVAAAAGESGGA